MNLDFDFKELLRYDGYSISSATRRSSNVAVGAIQRGGGFTLIELLVVIAIIGLLASVVLVALNNTRAKSRDAKRVADINQMAKAFELYYNEYSTYPTVTAAGTMASVITSTGKVPIVPKFLSKLPNAPAPNDGTCSSASIAGANEYYMYANVAGAQYVTSTYAITFCLGAKTGQLPAGPHTLTPSGIQ
jgi:general secretion pathway protein G